MADVEGYLREVIDDWWHRGPLAAIHELVGEVWVANVARFQPEERGDDALSLGIQSARNICNLAVRRCQGTPGVTVYGGPTLTVHFAGRVLHLGKATPEQSRDWNIWSIDWSHSDVRDRAADLNGQAYQPYGDTLFSGLEPDAGDPTALRHLHMAWQGFVAEAATRVWVGFPRAGPLPWFAVVPLGQVGATTSVPAPSQSAVQRSRHHAVAALDEFDIPEHDGLSQARPSGGDDGFGGGPGRDAAA
jgi:hypothetical protein